MTPTVRQALAQSGLVRVDEALARSRRSVPDVVPGLLMVDADPKIAPAVLPGNQRFYLGHEVVSIVTEVGPEVSLLKPGDRVITVL